MLLVDDEPLLLRAAARQLRRLGHDVHQADSYDAAVALLGGELSFDLVISDNHMPGRPGTDVLIAARDSRPSVRRIMLSSKPPRDLETLIETGVIHRFLLKPATRTGADGEAQDLFITTTNGD